MALDMTTALTIKANVKGEEELRGLQKGLNNVAGSSKTQSKKFLKNLFFFIHPYQQP